MGGQEQGGGGRRRQERESDRKKGNGMAGGRRLELRQRSRNSSLRENRLGGEKEQSSLLGPKTFGPGPQVDNGLRGPRERKMFQ